MTDESASGEGGQKPPISSSDPKHGRTLPSWTEGFLELTNGITSPKLFRKWAAITVVGAALTRRVWFKSLKSYSYGNMYVLLVGKPGLGKSEAVNRIRDIVRATLVKDMYPIAVEMMPYDVTKGALLDKLSTYQRWGHDPYAWSLGRKEKIKYHYGLLAISEFGNLVRDFDSVLLNTLHDLWDCPPTIEEERRYRSNNPIMIVNPGLALLGGTTSAYLMKSMPEQAWDEGFLARTIIVYSSEEVEPNLFDEDEIDLVLLRDLITDLRQVSRLEGEAEFAEETKKAIKKWLRAGKPPVPEHHKLEHYSSRRLHHALKLSLIASVDRSNDLKILPEDFQTALGWMIEAEKNMPQLFLEMSGRGDKQLLNDLYFHVKQIQEAPLWQGRPVRKSQLVDFLLHKAASWQVDQLINSALEAELLIRCPMPDGEIRYKFNPKASLLRPKRSYKDG